MLDPRIRALASTGRNFGMLAVHLRSGQIMNHVMWVDADDEHVLINTEIHRAKFRAAEDNPSVTVTVWRTEDPYAYGEVRGTVVATVGGAEAREHIEALSQRYEGREYRGTIESERVILKIRPDRQTARNL